MNNTNSRSLAKPKLFPELSLQNGKNEVMGLVMSGTVEPPAAARVLSTRGLWGLRCSQLSLWWQREMKHYRDIPREETDVIQHLNRLFQKERCRSPYNSHKCEPAAFFLLLKAGRTDSMLEIYSSVVLVA